MKDSLMILKQSLTRSSRSLSERIQQSLAQAERQSAVLILDVSGSMAEEVESGRSKLQALRELVVSLPSGRMIAFSDDARQVTAVPPQASGATEMDRAFLLARQLGATRAVVITDGIPTCPESAAIAAASGLKLDIYYVGPLPRPDFLDRLARSTGGTFTAGSLHRDDAPQLAQKIRGLLR